jgi:hypothetical protein
VAVLEVEVKNLRSEMQADAIDMGEFLSVSRVRTWFSEESNIQLRDFIPRCRVGPLGGVLQLHRPTHSNI